MSAIQTVSSNQSDFIQVRLDPKTKKAATNILGKLGLSPSQAIKIFLTQVIISRSIPFPIELPADYIEELSEEQSSEVGLALDQIKNGELVNIDMSDRQKVKKYLGV